ncbi:MAG: hypothetical protein NC338_00110 [Firmicutes bacterium]|nr:hypothetical protein [Bacillota bacterium]MCM1401440.1 hypothetical protein [Bacteroides sp.]
MKPLERTATLLLRSRLGTYLLIFLGTMAVLIAAGVAKLPAVATGRGLVTGASSPDFLTGPLSLFGALSMAAIIMFAMALINKAYNLLRTSSQLFLGVFAILQAANPIISTRICAGLLVALTVLCAMGLMYSVYQRPVEGTKRIFFAFTLLSAGAMMQYAFVAYIPVFLAGCAQMRCFSFRTLLAAVVGMVVPWWIALGPGIISISDITFPTGLNVFTHLDIADKAQLIAVIIVSVIIGFALTLTNMVKIYSYNARSRSFTGLLVTVTVATLLLTMVDFANVTAYLPLLNCCIAYQTALNFRINYENRGYITVCTILAIYFIMFVWSILI